MAGAAACRPACSAGWPARHLSPPRTWAATVCERVGNSLVMHAVLKPFSARPMAARRPAPPAPTTTASYVWSTAAGEGAKWAARERRAGEGPSRDARGGRACGLRRRPPPRLTNGVRLAGRVRRHRAEGRHARRHGLRRGRGVEAARRRGRGLRVGRWGGGGGRGAVRQGPAACTRRARAPRVRGTHLAPGAGQGAHGCAHGGGIRTRRVSNAEGVRATRDALRRCRRAARPPPAPRRGTSAPLPQPRHDSARARP